MYLYNTVIEEEDMHEQFYKLPPTAAWPQKGLY